MATKKSIVKKNSKKTSKKNASLGKSRIKGAIKRTLAKKELEREIEFSFYAPLASSVTIVGTFNSWNPSITKLTKDGHGNWKKTVSLKRGQYEYRFFVDGEWENDQKECTCIPNEHGSCNCVLHVT
ncbi:MAG: glycogen-binding domain-containing protein [Candidatus Omnitrophica bacterium]|nr:glycogen-binding domain-containing protein [Candidatus Omnitrophota bacterium]